MQNYAKSAKTVLNGYAKRGKIMLKSEIVPKLAKKLQGICTGGLDLNKNIFFGVY